jgi:hypothetical protein
MSVELPRISKTKSNYLIDGIMRAILLCTTGPKQRTAVTGQTNTIQN